MKKTFHSYLCRSKGGGMEINMNIYVMQTGSTLVSSAVSDRSTQRSKYAYTGLFQSRRSRIRLPVKAFMIETNGHRVLVDTGWSADCEDHPIAHMGFPLWFASEPVVTRKEAIPASLRDLHLLPQHIDAIVLTHLDCDHASGLRPLWDAGHIYCSKTEWHYANSKKDIRYNPNFWKDVHMETLEMEPDSSAPFGRSCDLFGDGSIKVVFTPGHTAGSVAVLAKGKTGYAAFVGDDGYNRKSWEELRLPGPVYDVKKMKRTLKWVQKLSRDENCIGIYAAHDPDGPKGGKNL